MADKDTLLNVNENDDFGFTFAEEKEVVITSTQHLRLLDKVEELERRLYMINSIFMPLLKNLAKEPDKPMIKWPGRKEILDKKMLELEELTRL